MIETRYSTRGIDLEDPREGPAMNRAIGGTESTFSLRDVFRIVWQRLWIVALVTLVCVGTALGLSLNQTPTYEASAKLLVGQEPGKDQLQGPLAGSVEGLQQLTMTMTEAIYSRPVAEEVIKELNVQETPKSFLENLTVEQVNGTQFISLSYRSADPERARAIVNAVSDVSSRRISEASASNVAIKATVWEYAVTPTAPVSPDPVRYALLALAVGIMLGVGLSFLLEYLDDSWRSATEVERISGVPTFGVIPEFEPVRRRKGKGKTTK
jgi:capsular polysaccharide biosynthesis protein